MLCLLPAWLGAALGCISGPALRPGHPLPLQALDAPTPATAARQQPALGRAAAVATTVQRALAAGAPRFSLSASQGGSALFDLDGCAPPSSACPPSLGFSVAAWLISWLAGCVHAAALVFSAVPHCLPPGCFRILPAASVQV
jgi:hypothetical protein